MSNEKGQTSTIRYNRIPRWLVVWAVVLTIVGASLTLIKRTPVICVPLIAEISENHPVIWKMLNGHDGVNYNPILGRSISENGYAEYIRPREDGSRSSDKAPYSVHHAFHEPQQKLPFSFDELFLAITMLGSFILLLSRSSSIQLKPHGITFPETFTAALRMRPSRAWSTITAVSLLETEKRGTSAKNSTVFLRFHFKTGEKIALDISRFSREDLETLLIAIEDWGERCAIAPEIITLRHKLQKSAKTTDNKSYT
ncbi:MAG: hypothetical protein K2Z81_26065, partial [Cyanobacteria bacterium]|nr:hypothetical protein [Cyanobacteriota bacterium]